VVNKSQVSANNPYVKPFGIKAKRTSIGWHDEISSVGAGGDMNPIHIIRECLTNTTWGGLGYPVADLDDAAFLVAASTIWSEGFGLSFIWDTNKSIDEFIGWVCSHINAVCFFSHVTGKMTIKLIRAVDTSTAPLLDESNILSLTSFTNSSVSEAVNQVTVKYIDRAGKSMAVTVHDIAGINRAEGSINSVELEYPGVAEASLASKIAARELTQFCTPLASVELVVNRTQYSLEVGDVFKLSWGLLGIENMVMRVSTVEFSQFTDNRMVIKAVRDIFSVGQLTFTEPDPSLWEDPIHAPANVPYRAVEELSWWQFTRKWGDSPTLVDPLTNFSCRTYSFCTAPSADAGMFTMYSKASGSSVAYTNRGIGQFVRRLLLPSTIISEATTTIILPLELSGITLTITPGETYFIIGEEHVGVDSVVTVDGFENVVVSRGVMDTLPVVHNAGTEVWVGLDNVHLVAEYTERLVGEVLSVKLLPTTPLGELPLADATEELITLSGRIMRPNPPRGLKINDMMWYDITTIGLLTELKVEFQSTNHRSETVTLTNQIIGGVLPYDGTAYVMKIYGETGTLLRTVDFPTPGAANTYTYLEADEKADSAFTPLRLNTQLRVEVYATLNGLVSREKWDKTIFRG
jgi:hypothetical protein